MKSLRTRVKLPFVITVFTLFSMAFTSAQAQQASPGPLSDIHSVRLNSFMALDEFYSFSDIDAGNTTSLDNIVEHINAANDAMNSMADRRLIASFPKKFETLNKDFDFFKSLMRENITDIRNDGYPDLRRVSDMANQARIIADKSNELYRAIRQSAQVSTNPTIEAARSSAFLLAQMMTKYSARTKSSVSQVFQGASDEMLLDEQARNLDKLLEPVIQARKSAPRLAETIDDISTKWQFIRSPYIKYTEYNAGFVINRYSKDILRGLSKISETGTRGA